MVFQLYQEIHMSQMSTGGVFVGLLQISLIYKNTTMVNVTFLKIDFLIWIFMFLFPIHSIQEDRFIVVNLKQNV